MVEVKEQVVTNTLHLSRHGRRRYVRSRSGSSHGSISKSLSTSFSKGIPIANTFIKANLGARKGSYSLSLDHTLYH
jgi:hypothetical protein